MLESDEKAKEMLKELRKTIAAMQSELDGINFNMEKSMRMRKVTNEHVEWSQRSSLISHLMEAVAIIALSALSVYWIKSLLDNKLIV